MVAFTSGLSNGGTTHCLVVWTLRAAASVILIDARNTGLYRMRAMACSADRIGHSCFTITASYFVRVASLMR